MPVFITTDDKDRLTFLEDIGKKAFLKDIWGKGKDVVISISVHQAFTAK